MAWLGVLDVHYRIIFFMDLNYPADPQRIKYSKIKIYDTKDRDRKILVGSDHLEGHFSIISFKIYKGTDPKAHQLSKIMHEEPHVFKSSAELKQFLQRSYSTIVETSSITVSGIIGFIRFLQGYYMIVFQDTKQTAKIGKHKIFEINTTQRIRLFEYQENPYEQEYYKMLDEYKMGLGFYGSYTYDLTHTLSKNILQNWETYQKMQDVEKPPQLNPMRSQSLGPEIPEHRFSPQRDLGTHKNIFLWNRFVLAPFHACLKNKKWIMPIVHGFCKQINVKTHTNMFSVCIIARRCRHHAGTRYLTRGINEEGFVGNFVESEQIVVDLAKSTKHRPAVSSFLQVRGSVPVFWYQVSSILTPKPPIRSKTLCNLQIVNISDPYLLATKKHFADLVALYGQQVYMVNLVKSNEHIPREQTLTGEFQPSVQAVREEISNADIDIGYLHFDMKAQLKQDKEEFVKKCYSLAYYCLMKTGVFVLASQERHNDMLNVELQNGIIRSNCIDCLDRTNTFQQLIGELALKLQVLMHLVIQIVGEDQPNSFKVQIIGNQRIGVRRLSGSTNYLSQVKMYEELGDIISLQYGSSLAHKQEIGDKQGSKKRFEFKTSVIRHYKNNVSDQKRQNQMDLFLGHHRPVDEPLEPLQSSITLFPNIQFLDTYQYGKEWYLPALQHFYEQSHIAGLEVAHLGESRFTLMLNRNDTSISNKRASQRKAHFNFDVILKHTMKNDKPKSKDQNTFRFMIRQCPSNVEYKKDQRKSYANYNLVRKMRQKYNDLTIIEEQEKEDNSDSKKQETKEIQQSGIIKEEDKPVRQFIVGEQEKAVFNTYLQPRSMFELFQEANTIDELTFQQLTDEQIKDLTKELQDYVQSNQDHHYCDFGKPAIINHQHPVFDHLYMDDRTKMKMDQFNFSLSQDNRKTLDPRMEYEQQLHATISVQQPKKKTIEQKKLQIIESLCKQSFSQTQKIKVNIL